MLVGSELSSSSILVPGSSCARSRDVRPLMEGFQFVDVKFRLSRGLLYALPPPRPGDFDHRSGNTDFQFRIHRSDLSDLRNDGCFRRLEDFEPQRGPTLVPGLNAAASCPPSW